MSKTDTSTDVANAVANAIVESQPYSPNSYKARDILEALAAERDTLTKQLAGAWNTALEVIARLIDQKVKDYIEENGSYDSTTGHMEYPSNGEEWVGDMEELAEELRDLKSKPVPNTELSGMPDTIFAGIVDGFGGWHEQPDIVNRKKYMSADKIECDQKQLHVFRTALRQVFAWASEARPAGYENAILKIEEISESALKSERAPHQNSDDELQRMQAAVDQGKDII